MTATTPRLSTLTREVAHLLGELASKAAGLLRPRAADRSPGERSVLDDIAMRRPWNLRVKAERLRARLRRRGLQPGVTVIVVNWNTLEVTADVVSAVKRLAPHGTTVLVIDNGSTDGSREVFRNTPGIRTKLLRSNAGHGVALDLGMCWVETTIAVTLDSDALPLAEGWLEPAVHPICSGNAKIAGLRASRGFVHPVYSALDVETFLSLKLSFQVHREPRPASIPDVWGVNSWDTGEWMFREYDADEVHFVDLPSVPAPDPVGATTGGILYHFGGVSRGSSGAVSPESLAAWKSARHVLNVEGV